MKNTLIIAVSAASLLLLAACDSGSRSSGGAAAGGGTSNPGNGGSTSGGAKAGVSGAAGGALSSGGGSLAAAGAGGSTGVAGAGGALGSAGAANAGGATALTVTVSGASPKPVAATFFGQNFWSWPDMWSDPVSLVKEPVKALRLGLLRAGGANNDTQSPEPFTNKKVDEFVAYARAIGAEPVLQVPAINNAAGTAATAQDAADLVTYVNKTKAYGVRYFEIGNEPDLYVDQALRPATYSAAELCTSFGAFADAMRAADPSISIVGPDLSWKYTTGANDWLTPFLQSCGSKIDIVAVHRYPIDPKACTEAAAYADAAQFRAAIQHVRAIMAATGQSAKPLAFTEANITWDGTPETSNLPASPGSFPAGLWVADTLGIGLEEGLFSEAYWSLSEGWTLGFLNGTTPRPAYYALGLVATTFGDQVLAVTGAPAGVSVYAGRDSKKGTTNLLVVNKTQSPLSLACTLAGLPRTDSPTIAAAPLSLTVAVLADSGGAPVLTSYTSGMAQPMPVTN